ncbi:Holliday junction resolvase RuvX [Thermanaeromonas sp. C210]|uniref:Holliday junction resolvase RuvX n=1 Tax=Thermanaeromonas sp. C210 TaxID=2731925 RepID=UPI00155C6325|nr:putative pre-16S rRNA nuclease [Thermanaeromonas sp. C210]
MRVMGLDVGEKTIGVAVSDPLGWTAQGVTTLKRGERLEEDLRALEALAKEYGVDQVVVGLPRNMNGSLGPQAEKVLAFIRAAREFLGLPVVPWDERLTTVEAERLLVEADLSRRRRKRIVDRLAAVLILQSYLDCHPSDRV